MKFRPAFNLIEIVVFLLVVSVLLSIIFMVMKPQKVLPEKNIQHKYAAAYDALNLTLFELIKKDETNPFIEVIKVPSTNPNEPSTEKIQTVDPKKGYKKLCKGLAEYINAYDDETKCSVPLAKIVANMTLKDTYDFRNRKPEIRALNGIAFHISELIIDDKTPNNTRSYYNEENPDFTIMFYIVYADLNSRDYPNRAHTIAYDPTGKTPTDVYAFALLPTGDAIPIGLAEYNIKVLPTRISYKDSENTRAFTPYYSYHEAKHKAWDWYNAENSNDIFNDKISFTYNTFIKEILLRSNSKMYNFNSNNIFPEKYSEAMFDKCFAPSGTQLTSYDMCKINVDTPTFGETH